MLHVWLRAQHSSLAVWHADTQHWQIVDGWQQLHDMYQGYKSSGYKTNSHKTLCLYFPSSHMLQVDTALSSAQLKQLGSMGKQYLFEEISLTPVEQLAIRQINHSTMHHLYALAQSDIDAWQQSATLTGLTIQALLPDFLLLPLPTEGAGQQITLYQDEYTTLLRQSQHQGLAVSYLPLIFERLPQLSEVCVLSPIEADAKQSTSAPVSVDVVEAIDRVHCLQQTEQVAASAITAETASLISQKQLLLTVLSATPTPVDIPERQALNFFIKTSQSKLSPYLRVALMVAMAALVLQVATDGLQVYRYNAATNDMQTTLAIQYQAWFPNEPLNLRTKLQTQMQPKLRSDSQASTSHMAVLARISPLIKQSSLHAQALVMQPNALSFTLIAPDRVSLDQFASMLVEQGLSANLERVNSDEQGQFSGQITVNIIDDNTGNVDDTKNDNSANS